MSVLEDEDEKEAARLLSWLDQQHARATHPSLRRRIEQEMENVRSELARRRRLAKVVDDAFERWKEHTSTKPGNDNHMP